MKGKRSDDILLEMINITKEFPGVKALDGVSLRVRRGTVHALMGENGAGKSTLIKVLTGVYEKDSGTIDITSSVEMPSPSRRRIVSSCCSSSPESLPSCTLSNLFSLKICVIVPPFLPPLRPIAPLSSCLFTMRSS